MTLMTLKQKIFTSTSHLTILICIVSVVFSIISNMLINGYVTMINIFTAFGVPAILAPIVISGLKTYIAIDYEREQVTERFSKVNIPAKISGTTFELLSQYAPVFSICSSALPYISWFIITRITDHTWEDSRYISFGLMAIANFIVALYSYRTKNLTPWIYMTVAIYSTVPIFGLFQSLSISNMGLISVCSVILALIASWKTVFIYTTAMFSFMAISYVYAHEYMNFTRTTHVYSEVESDGSGVMQIVEPLNIELTDYSSLTILYFATLVIAWITDHLVRAGATKRQELIVAYNQLEEKKTHQDHMFAIIGHELRTPIAAATMMIEDVVKSSPGRNIASAYFDTILNTKHELEHTLSILDDMRIVSSKDTVKEYASINDYPAQVIKRVCKTLSTEAAEAGITIKTHFNFIAGDRYFFPARALSQIGLNIIKNAIRHSKASTIDVSIKGEEFDGEHSLLTLKITDDGIGIPSHLHDKIFDAFYSHDASNTANTGLGLFIVKELAEVLSGTVKVKSTVGEGTTFIVEIKLKQSVNQDIWMGQEETKPQSVSWAGKRVLIVEDNMTIQMMTQKILQGLGAIVDCADNGEAGMLMLKFNTYDIIITDYFMPEMDGVQLCQAVREKYNDLPIIGVTAATVGEEFEQLMKAGANIVISKPANSKKLTDALMEISE